MLQKVKPAVQLKDMSLFRQQCYIDGEWVDADNKATFAVYNPADGQQIGTVPNMGAAETRRAIEAANAAWPAWRAKTRQGARRDPAQVVRPDDGQPGRPRDPDDGRAGQAARRVARRDRLRRVVHRVVRRGRQARLRRHDPGAVARQAHRRDQAADRRVRRDHAVEFPQRDDHAQGGPGARRRLHHGDQAREQDAATRRWRCASSPSAPAFPKGVFSRDHRRRRPDRQGADHQPDRAQVHLHRLDRGRQEADGAVREHGEEGVARAGRQRAVHRVRRRRPRRGGRGRDGLQVPQHRPDLRLRQPHLRAGRRLRRVRAEARREGRGDEGRQRPRERA